MLSFLFRAGVVLFVLAAVLSEVPGGPSGDGGTSGNGSGAAIGLIGFAAAAVSDAAGFCERRPDACEGAGEAFAELGPRVIHLVQSLATTMWAGGAAPPQGASPPVLAREPVEVAGASSAAGTLAPADFSARWSVPTAE